MAMQVPVEERLHIETLRLFMENAKVDFFSSSRGLALFTDVFAIKLTCQNFSKLRKVLNDYSEGILHNTLSRVEGKGLISHKM